MEAVSECLDPVSGQLIFIFVSLGEPFHFSDVLDSRSHSDQESREELPLTIQPEMAQWLGFCVFLLVEV